MPAKHHPSILVWAIALLCLAPCGLQACTNSAIAPERDAAPVESLAVEPEAVGGAQAPIMARAKAEGMRQAAADQAPPAAASNENTPAAPPAASQGRELIRRAELNLNVPAVADAAASVQAMARKLGGFVGDMRWEAAEGGRPSAQLTVRVPASRFDAFVDQVGGVGRLVQKVISTEDVTAEVVDSKARVRNLKAEEMRLVELLKRAGKLSEVLEVEREITRVRGEVEQIQSRLRELSNLVGLATVVVQLSERIPQAQVGGWALNEAWSTAWQEASDELGRSLRRHIATATRLALVEAPNLLFSLLGVALVYALSMFLAMGLLVKRGPQWPASKVKAGALALAAATLIAFYPALIAFLLLFGAVIGLGVLLRWAWPKLAGPAFDKKRPAPPANAPPSD